MRKEKLSTRILSLLLVALEQQSATLHAIMISVKTTLSKDSAPSMGNMLAQNMKISIGIILRR